MSSVHTVGCKLFAPHCTDIGRDVSGDTIGRLIARIVSPADKPSNCVPRYIPDIGDIRCGKISVANTVTASIMKQAPNYPALINRRLGPICLYTPERMRFPSHNLSLLC